MPKRKNLSTAVETVGAPGLAPDVADIGPAAAPPAKRRAKERNGVSAKLATGSTNPDKNAHVLDSSEALRASPDADGKDEQMNITAAGVDANTRVKTEEESLDTGLKEPVGSEKTKGAGKKKSKASAAVESESDASAAKVKKETSKEPQFLDPEADGDDEADEAELQAALSRPPPVNSDYLPLPWKGRLGYACLNTYLRFSNPPVFSSRTCRIASILENRHPLTNPDEPPHATKNRPDRNKPADIARGQAFVESLGKQNAKDIVKMLRWNDKYGIKFMRLSSEMFPFASHAEYGYTLAPFVSEELAEAGRVATELGHRLTTHPGQYTQLGSPRKEVIDNAIRDLEYHSELLSLLKMPPQQDRDAVMILHLGGVFGDKAATLDRFRENYAKLSPGIKKRLVLENDDVSWSVHDLLPICEELNIPMVLDFHHHNIIFDSDKLREGTKDIIDVFPRIIATWRRKNITPKMHYSEPTPAAITGRQRRKHSPRVATLPPCPPDTDLMIEAKDKEQAVFELMRTFKLPGYHTFNDIIPHVRKDDNKAALTPKRKSAKKPKKKTDTTEEDTNEESGPELIPDDEVGMGGPENRVYWPPGMEEWLRPAKRVVKPKDDSEAGEKKLTPAQKKKKAAAEAATQGAKVEEEVQAESQASNAAISPTPAHKKATTAAAKTNAQVNAGVTEKPKKTAVKNAKRKSAKHVPTSSTSDEDLSDIGSDILSDDDEEEKTSVSKKAKVNGNAKVKGKNSAAPTAGRGRASRAKRVSYAEGDDEGDGDE